MVFEIPHDTYIPYIEEKFDAFNKLIFGGELPRIPIVLGSATSVVGAFSYKARRNFWGKKEYFDLKLRFSKKFDLPENELEDVIIHEMIHYYIHFKNLKDKSAHGPLFKNLMNQINKTFGRKISIRYRGSSALRIHYIDHSTLQTQLQGATKLSLKDIL